MRPFPMAPPGANHYGQPRRRSYFIDHALVGKYIVFRFVIEDSRLRDFGP
jgi:hypothetical protein